jgi:UDP-N-acetylmuramyl pentapeptide synthase
LIANLDDSYVREQAAAHPTLKTSWFGTSGDADFRASDIAISLAGTSFDLHWPSGRG